MKRTDSTGQTEKQGISKIKMKPLQQVCDGCVFKAKDSRSVPRCFLIFSMRMEAAIRGEPEPEHGVVPDECPRYLEQMILGQRERKDQ